MVNTAVETLAEDRNDDEPALHVIHRSLGIELQLQVPVPTLSNRAAAICVLPSSRYSTTIFLPFALLAHSELPTMAVSDTVHLMSCQALTLLVPVLQWHLQVPPLRTLMQTRITNSYSAIFRKNAAFLTTVFVGAFAFEM